MNDNHESPVQKRSPWREPMVWLVFAIPAAAVFASFALLYESARSSGNNDMVPDEVQRTAQIQTADLTPDARAQQMHLSAVARTAKGTIEVDPVSGEFDRHAPLQLSLHHPTAARLDMVVELAPSANGWSKAQDIDLSHDWNVQLAPANGAWKLHGRWVARQQAIYLRPAIGSD
ncbi:MAG: FixH family protein [Proteobacteria bacterium]|nr:FixH family protein [Pseudomonadota bacterium]